MPPDTRLHPQMGIAIFLPHLGQFLSLISHGKSILVLFN